MSSVGAYLRDLRVQRGVSLEEMARATRVAQRYLEALEAEDFRALPEPVFARGFVRAYCQVLGHPPEEALVRYASADHRLQAAEPVHVAAGHGDEGRGRGVLVVSFALLVVFGAALFAVSMVLQSGREPETAREATPAGGRGTEIASAPARPAAPLPAPSAPAPPPAATAPTPPVAPPAESPAPGAAPAPGSERPVAAEARSPETPTSAPVAATLTAPYRLVARTSEPTWISVRTAEGRISEETIPGGQVREWVSSKPFLLTIGNAGGVTLELNGRPLPPLGARGAVVTRLTVPREAP
jgi:cytoskeleton protein RodZ